MAPDPKLLAMLYQGFYRCPTNGRVLPALHGDDKVLCNCGRSNPEVPTERTHLTGTHVLRYLAKASVEAFVAQETRTAL